VQLNCDDTSHIDLQIEQVFAHTLCLCDRHEENWRHYANLRHRDNSLETKSNSWFPNWLHRIPYCVARNTISPFPRQVTWYIFRHMLAYKAKETMVWCCRRCNQFLANSVSKHIRISQWATCSYSCWFWRRSRLTNSNAV